MNVPAGERPPAPRRRALLLACARFDDPALPHLRSPVRDADALGAVLADPSGPEYEVTTHVDCTAHEARLAIEQFFAAARPRDVHLLYFSCHGLQDPGGDLYFAFTDTQGALPGATAVSAEWVRARMQGSRSRTTIVLVDCCFSGAFMRGMRAKSGSDANVGALVRDLPEGSGVAVLTASGATEYSLEHADERADAAARPSYFTEAVFTGIATGAADLDRDGHITVDELYTYVYQRIVEGPSPQRPRKMGHTEGQVVIASVPRRIAEPPPPPEPPDVETTQVFAPDMQFAPWPPLPPIAREPRPSRPPAPARPANATVTQPRWGRPILRRFLKAALAVGLLVAVAGVAVQLRPGHTETGHAAPAVVTVPNVVGQQQAAAEGMLTDVELRAEFVTVPSAAADVGKVLAAEPAPGAQVARHSTVRLNVGMGPEQVTVPDLTGKTTQEATILLSQAGLALLPAWDEQVVADGKLIGKIIKQDPAPNTQAAKDSPVRVTIGIGARVLKVTVINVVGQLTDTAAGRLQAIGFFVRLVEVDSVEPAGEVVGQNPRAGAQLDRGATVVLNVSKGNQFTMPDLVGDTVAQAQGKLRALGWTGTFDQLSVEAGGPSEVGKIVKHNPGAAQPTGWTQTVQIHVGMIGPTTTG